MVTATLQQFQEKIRDEFVNGSAISPEVFEANIRIHGDVEFTASGDVSAPIHDALGWQKTRFGHQASPTFWAAHLCHIDGSVWQAKLSQPLAGKNGKPRKYESPKGGGSHAYFPNPGAAAIANLEKQSGKPAGAIQSENYWNELEQAVHVPIIITEGGKKSLCLLSHGYPAIALYGVNGGYRANGFNGETLIAPKLIDDLSRFAKPGRPIILAFDQDTNLETRSKVNHAIGKTARLFTKQGCSVFIAQWSAIQGKGVDDLIAGQGIEAWETALDAAVPLEAWGVKARIKSSLKRKPSLAYDVPGLLAVKDEIQAAIPDRGLIAIKAAKGGEKTKLMMALTSPDQVDSLLIIGHLISLTRGNCNKFQACYRTDNPDPTQPYFDRQGRVNRAGLAVPSLLTAPLGRFDENGDLVIDEAVQVARFLLASSICGKDGARPSLLAEFRRIIQKAKRVWIADADLNDATIAWYEALRGDGQQCLLIHNRHVPKGYKAIFYDDLSKNDFIGLILSHAQRLPQGKMLFVPSDTKRSVKRIARLLEGNGIKTLAIHSESSGGEIERRFISNPSEAIPELLEDGVRVVLASPSVGTGVSIEVMGVFEAVYGLFSGCSTQPSDICQHLQRLRPIVDRHIWVPKRGRNYSKISESCYLGGFLRDLRSKTDIATELLRRSLTPADSNPTHWADGYDWDNPHLKMFGALEVARNLGMADFGAEVKARLELEGCQVVLAEPSGKGKVDGIDQQLKQVAALLREEEALLVLRGRIICYSDFCRLSESECLSVEDLAACKRFMICDFYRIAPEELTLEDVIKDRDGQRRSEIKNLEEMLNPELAKTRTGKSFEGKDGSTPHVWDLSSAQIKAEARIKLGLRDWLLEAIQSNVLPPIEALAANIRHFAKSVKQALGFTVRPDMSDRQIVNQLFAQMGIRFAAARRLTAADGSRYREYTLLRQDWLELKAIVDRRAATSTPPPQFIVDPKDEGGVDIDPGWLTPESLEDVRSWLESAQGNPKMMQEVRAMVPASVLEFVLGRQNCLAA